MKKTLTSISTLALFAGAAFAEDVNVTVSDGFYSTNTPSAIEDIDEGASVSYEKINVDITGGQVLESPNVNSAWRNGYYGGAWLAGNTFNADEIVMNMSDGTMNNIVAGCYGVNKTEIDIARSEINITGGCVLKSVLGGNVLTFNDDSVGMAKSKTGSSNIKISGTAVVGEKVYSAKDKAENNDVIFGSVYGGGYTVGHGTQTFGSTNIEISGKAVVNGVVIGGSHAGPTGNAYVGNADSSDFSQVVSAVSVSENAEIRGGYVFGGAYASWGSDGKSSDIYGSTRVVVSGGKIFNEAENAGYVFGGGYASDGNSGTDISNSTVYGNTNVEVNGGIVSNVYGGMYVNEAYGYGGASGVVKGDTNVVVSGGEVANIYGGSMVERVTGTADITLSSTVEGNSNVFVSSAVNGDIYGGGNGAESVVRGNSNIALIGNASVDGTIYGNGANGGVVEGAKTLNIGSATEAYAGATVIKFASFDKINIRSGSVAKFDAASAEKFAGALNIESGSLAIGGGLGASSVSIADGASLGLTVGGANVLSNSSLAFENGGTFSLTARAGLAAGEYDISAAGITDYGNTKAYGGSISGNKFIVAEAESMNLDKTGERVSVSDNGRLNLSREGSTETTIVMAFNSDNATVNAVNTTTDSLTAQLSEDFKIAAAYSFDVDMASGDTVTLSFLVGDSSLNLSDFTIFHKNSGDSQWSKADDISDASYDGEYLSFVVSHFSEYGYSAVPEPSTYAAIFGALALGFAVYRRRK